MNIVRMLSRILVLACAAALAACAVPFWSSTPDKAPAATRPLPSKPSMVVEDEGGDGGCRRKVLERSLGSETRTLTATATLLKDRSIAITLPSDPVFDRGSAQFKPESLLPLQRLGVALRACDDAVLNVLVYADGAGGRSLAERRAQVLAEYLARQDLPIARIRQEGRAGEGRAQHPSRRIEIVIKPIDSARPDAAWVAPGS